MSAKSARNILIYSLLGLIVLRFFMIFILSFLDEYLSSTAPDIISGFTEFTDLAQQVGDLLTYILVAIAVIAFIVYIAKRATEQKNESAQNMRVPPRR